MGKGNNGRSTNTNVIVLEFVRDLVYVFGGCNCISNVIYVPRQIAFGWSPVDQSTSERSTPKRVVTFLVSISLKVINCSKVLRTIFRLGFCLSLFRVRLRISLEFVSCIVQKFLMILA